MKKEEYNTCGHKLISYKLGYNAAMQKKQSNDVQQAAKEWKEKNAKFVYDDQSAMMLENAFLAGASFNSDAVEFLEWVFENGYVYNTGNGYLWLNDVPYLVDETYSVFKQNNIQQAHDKSTNESLPL